MTERAYLVLSDGTTFEGTPFGARGEAAGEAVFTTGMTGYQEVLTDPSYCGQIVTMTAPQIGNTGVNDEDMETQKPAVAGFVVRDLSPIVSSWRAAASLEEFLVKHGIPGIAGVDTRALTRHIRDHGAQTGVIGTGAPEALLARAKAERGMAGQDLTGRVSTGSRYEWSECSGAWSLAPRKPAKHHVVAIDFGVKRNILRCLVDAGCKVTVVPSTTTADEVLALAPDGVFLSNGPGDPAAVTHGIETISALVGKKPIFGICLGHQMLALALGAKSFKLKFGHRGLNQPVKDLSTGRIEITTQNHGFAVDVDSLPEGITMTHVHLNDGTCQGIEAAREGAFSVQFHPEAAAGPHDSRYLFERFVTKMDAAAPRPT
jgi:carbamoyl-phosphate synthase small subunit